jgi:hypothetical protein
MSTATFPGPFPTGISNALSQHLNTAAASRKAKSTAHIIRRQPTMQQGKALETLGRAVEYLIDSRLHMNAETASPADVEAGQILMRLNRAVFAQCREIVPFGTAFRLWLRRMLALDLV